jgi:hypothetical protein
MRDRLDRHGSPLVVDGVDDLVSPRRALCLPSSPKCSGVPTRSRRSAKTFGRWGETFGDDVVAAVMIGRLEHHAVGAGRGAPRLIIRGASDDDGSGFRS